MDNGGKGEHMINEATVSFEIQLENDSFKILEGII